ncbi:hypothetical protein C8Q80DRAFT_1117920 [Daedaleopsis nitida]|nr:hypothetical protein C8Q80DRAFT_1117920 [Daedaleopsis nitida]
MAESRKRARLSDEEEVDEKPFVNHPTLYFDDGNVILRTGWTLFCVHKSLLSKHSLVFANMFRHNEDRFRGLTQLTMEETREDLEALLSVLYDGLRIDVEELSVETFPALATLLRMATKFQVDRPCKDIIACIRAQWPASLAQHDAREDTVRATLAAAPAPPAPVGNGKAPAMGQGQGQAGAGPSNLNVNAVAAQGAGGGGAAAAAPQQAPQEDLIVHPGSVIALLRECKYNDASLLFPLFYALSRTTWQFGGPALGHHLAPLSVADMERFVVGIERLRSSHASRAALLPPFDAVPTNPPHFCSAGAQQLWSSLVLTPLATKGLQRAHQPLEEWRDVVPLINAQYLRYQICQVCAAAIVIKINTYRQNLWALLPTFFELV